jgi:hypothetical protein
MSAYPLASGAKIEETKTLLETSSLATAEQTLLQQILVAVSVNAPP